MGHNVQVVWEKFARYFDVEPRYVPLTDERFVLGVPEAVALVDENTIGVVGVLGSTYTGEYEPIKELSDALAGLNGRTGRNVPACTLAPDAEHISVLRVVVREGLSRDMADILIEDLRRVVEYLDAVHAAPQKVSRRPHHGKTKGVC